MSPVTFFHYIWDFASDLWHYIWCFSRPATQLFVLLCLLNLTHMRFCHWPFFLSTRFWNIFWRYTVRMVKKLWKCPFFLQSVNYSMCRYDINSRDHCRLSQAFIPVNMYLYSTRCPLYYDMFRSDGTKDVLYMRWHQNSINALTFYGYQTTLKCQ